MENLHQIAMFMGDKLGWISDVFGMFMQVRRYFAGLIVVLGLVLQAGSGNASSRDATEELLGLLGYDVFVEGVSDALRNTDNAITGDDAGLSVAWDLAAMETFPPHKMMAEIVSAMDGQLDAGDIEAATAFLTSDLGRLVTQMEVDAQRPGQSEIVDTEGAARLAELIASDDARLDAYTRMIEALGAIDSEVASAMNLNYAIYAGMSQSGLLPYRLSEAEILQLVASQQDMIRAHIRDRIYVTFVYTYRDLSDQDLADYIAFLTSDAGRAVYGAISVATEDVMGRRARQFGARLMQLQGVQEL